MTASRLDLDEKGAGSPDGIVIGILKAESNLQFPIPIERLCCDLDIESIEDFESEGFEGGLVTDTARSKGVILTRAGNANRRRFTIGHELGHFLMPTHVPNFEGRFLCSRADMRKMSAKENDRRGRMEVEANRFASLILMPPPLLRPLLVGDPSIAKMATLAERIQVSREAMARSYSQYHDQALAFVFVKDGTVRYSVKGLKFPYLNVEAGAAVPSGTLVARERSRPGTSSELRYCVPDYWINVEWGTAAPTLYEQVLWQEKGFAIVMLWHEARDTDDDRDQYEDMTSKQRYERQQYQRNR